MLIDGELDAAIYGAELPKDPRLQSLIRDPDAAAQAWYGQHGLVPVNHMVVVTEALARANPAAVAELYGCWKPARPPACRPPARSTPRRSARRPTGLASNC